MDHGHYPQSYIVPSDRRGSVDYTTGPMMPTVPAVPSVGTLDYNQQLAHHRRSYIPSLLPPGVDPASVDFRAFHPYMPNEVKHRKRTSRAQFKVLEETFEKHTKPNQELRKQLSSQLDMTPRAVQVWFQNRRAKEKNQKKKADDVRKTGGAETAGATNALKRDDSPSSPDQGGSSSSPTPNSPSQDDDLALADPTSPTAPIEQVPLPPSSAEPSPLSGAPPTHPWSPEHDPLLHLRRGSLPVGVGFGMAGTHHDPHGRRRSIDTGLSRLARHPYAPMARAANNSVHHRASFAAPNAPATATAAATMPHGAPENYLHPLVHRPMLSHRASMPYALNQFGDHQHHHYHHPQAPMAPVGGMHPHGPAAHFAPRLSLDPRYALHRGSMDSVASSTTSPEHAFPPHGGMAAPNARLAATLSSRTRLLDDGGFNGGALALSTRSVSSPIPGPLPSPTFAFGAASGVVVAETEALNAELNAFAFPAREGGASEDGASSVATSAAPSSMGFESYPFGSRYGSIASIAESEASSAYFSEASGACFDDAAAGGASRRPSYATGMFDMFGQMHVEAHAALEASPLDQVEGQQQQQQKQQQLQVNAGVVGYPSPDSTSTVSPGGSPSPPRIGGEEAPIVNAPAPTLTISSSSELAYALSPDQQSLVSSSNGSPASYHGGSSPHEGGGYLSGMMPAPTGYEIAPHDASVYGSSPHSHGSGSSSSLNLSLGAPEADYKQFAMGPPPTQQQQQQAYTLEAAPGINFNMPFQ